jgi:hypothetical protein
MTTEIREYTAQDIEQVAQAEKQLQARGLDEPDQRIADILDGYFRKNRGVSVTVQNVVKIIEATPGLKWLSAAENAWRQTAQQNPALANQLAAHAATQGRPGQLVNDGDSLFENLALLFTEINSRRESASPQTIAAAEDRILHRPGKQLVRLPQPRRTEPVSRAAKDSPGTDSTNWLGDMVKTPDGSYRSKTVHEQRCDMETAERAKNSQSQTSALDASEASWKAMADGLLQDGTHSQQTRVRAAYDAEQGNGWRRVYEACRKEANLYRNRSIR